MHENNLLVCTNDLKSEQLLSDRSTNPRLGDIYRLKSEWDQTNSGPRQGKAKFEEFEARIEQFNKDCEKSGGKAVLQKFHASKIPGKTLLLFLQFALLSCAEYINMYSRQES